MGTSKRERKYKDKNETMDTKTNQKFKVLINGERFLKYTYTSYIAAHKAGENSTRESGEYFDVIPE